MVSHLKMAVFHCPMVSLCSTTFITWLAPTKAKTLKFSTIGLCSPLSITRGLFLVRVATPVQKYVYPDPIPEFAVYETNKFREELKKKLFKEKETFGNDLDTVVETCTQLFCEFLHNEYGGPGTLLVDPFTNMFIELKQKNLPGANFAARASLLWAQNYLDHDWQIWNSKSP